MKTKRTFIQCGYEGDCKHKDCLKCPRKRKHNLNLTLAEEIAIEDFAVCDLEAMMNGGQISKHLEFPDKRKQLDLMQNIMYKVMRKIFKRDKNGRKTNKA